MVHAALNWTFRWGFFACFVVWGILLLAMVVHLIRKNYPAFRLNLLYTLNTFLFFIGWGYAVTMAMIVNFTERDTYAASVAELKRQGVEHFWNFTWWALLWVAIFGVFNYLYLRFIHKKVEWKRLIRLGMAGLTFLLLCAWLSVEYYYTNMMGEIIMHFPTG